MRIKIKDIEIEGDSLEEIAALIALLPTIAPVSLASVPVALAYGEKGPNELQLLERLGRKRIRISAVDADRYPSREAYCEARLAELGQGDGGGEVEGATIEELGDGEDTGEVF